MLHAPLLIPPSAAFWGELAGTLLDSEHFGAASRSGPVDLSAVRVVVPTAGHAQLLKAALAARLDGGAFIPPRVTTLAAWLDLYPPDAVSAGPGRRLMTVYAELRQHGWLKKLFGARRNTDLLPLAQTLLALSDELTQAMLPAIGAAPDSAGRRWEQALQRFAPPLRQLLSDESQLVWTIWKSQLDGSDALAAQYAQMMRLADSAQHPLIWVSSTEPDPFARAFLERYGARRPVLPVLPDWRAGAVSGVYAAAWTEVLDGGAPEPEPSRRFGAPDNLALHQARTLEGLAQHGARTILDWLSAGKTSIGLIAQDRVAARRIRALLERAQVYVTDETGWKLSTTRAAAAPAAWLEVVAARGDTVALLDLLKSPFVFAQRADKPQRVMAIELALRRAGVRGGWDAMAQALARLPAERELVAVIARQAGAFAGRRTLCEWVQQTRAVFDALEIGTALQADAAGAQLMALLDGIDADCEHVVQPFSFPEWRSFLNAQMEAVAFTPPRIDRRVMMMPLNGARLRGFDAVLVVGADAEHLPSQPAETLFFANGVRRELGLATRETLQRQQLRDFTELLQTNPQVVLSWQSHKDGEPNPVSPWIARLVLALEQNGLAPPAELAVQLEQRRLQPRLPERPAPTAPQLAPDRFSASGYNMLVACPYQFFASRMLGLSALDEFTDLPEKRDYGDWLHRILRDYHEQVRDGQVAPAERPALLARISDGIFGKALAAHPAALGYYMRWRKAMPAYLAWSEAREASGWRFERGEVEFSKQIETAAGTVTLYGRVDRLDRSRGGEYAVLDYKTRNAADLKKKLKEGEDHQLAFYGLIADVPVSAAHLVGLDAGKDKIGDAPAEDYEQWKAALEQHIRASVEAIARGAGLPAQGIETVCRYCEVRGLCRKGNW